MAETARIFEAKLGGFWLETPYVPDFVDDLKSSLPKFSRKWDPDLKMWWVATEFVDRARAVLRRHYELDGTTTMVTRNSDDSAWEILWLRPGAPFEVLRAAYRALAQLHHPDVGGDTRKMQKINSAYERLVSGGGA